MNPQAKSIRGAWGGNAALLLVAGAVLAIGVSQIARALPPPMAEDKLLSRSELVIVADVLGVACTGLQENGIPEYTAWLQIVATEKGEGKPFSTLQVVWSGIRPGLIGPWESKLYAGSRVRLFLVSAEQEGSWRVFHYSGKKELVAAPKESRQLPQKTGEVFFRNQPAPGPSTEQKGCREKEKEQSDNSIQALLTP